ncbi:MAG: hypothetical protein GX485_07015 [Clostridiales bacterium]|nr:hypothetical protein [Clostridiales bacterium]
MRTSNIRRTKDKKPKARNRTLSDSMPLGEKWWLQPSEEKASVGGLYMASSVTILGML